MRGNTILCALCGETVTAPAGCDPGLFGDLIEAHGATHGQDWRNPAAATVAVIEAQRNLSYHLDALVAHLRRDLGGLT